MCTGQVQYEYRTGTVPVPDRYSTSTSTGQVQYEYRTGTVPEASDEEKKVNPYRLRPLQQRQQQEQISTKNDTHGELADEGADASSRRYRDEYYSNSSVLRSSSPLPMASSLHLNEQGLFVSFLA